MKYKYYLAQVYYIIIIIPLLIKALNHFTVIRLTGENMGEEKDSYRKLEAGFQYP